MSIQPYFGTGTTPEKVRDAIERAREERDRHPSSRRPVTTADRDRFFAAQAEEIKRAGGDPG